MAIVITEVVPTKNPEFVQALFTNKLDEFDAISMKAWGNTQSTVRKTYPVAAASELKVGRVFESKVIVSDRYDTPQYDGHIQSDKTGMYHVPTIKNVGEKAVEYKLESLNVTATGINMSGVD